MSVTSMSVSGYILAIDQGTTGTTALLVDGSGRVLWQAYREITQIYPQPGWVEHDPSDIFDSVIETVDELLEATEIHPRQIIAIGIANQRETTIVWERATGKPVSNAIVWQCRRTAPLCDDLKARGLEATVAEKTGLPIDAYFPATKIRWILDSIPDGQQRAESGELAFGTVDTWLLWQLTNGTVHATDVTNASRSMLYNIDSLEWDAELLDIAGHTCGDASLGNALKRSLRLHRRQLLRGTGNPHRGRRRRPARRPIRPGLLRAGNGEEHLRHGFVHPDEHGRTASTFRARLAVHHRMGTSATA